MICIVAICTSVSSVTYNKKIYKKISTLLHKPSQPSQFKPSKLALKMLCGKNGIEIGASTQNSFYLTDPKYCNQIGGYLNVDFTADQGGKWQDGDFAPMIVNIVATGDKLPFKNESLDYVLSSHMIEHSFDPVDTIKEWLRVVKKGGYIFIIAPHKDRTFDKNRDITQVTEILDRHNGKINIRDYAMPISNEAAVEYLKSIGKTGDKMGMTDIPSLLVSKNDKLLPNWRRYTEDDHHHWTVWNTESFLDLCKAMKWNVIEYQDVDDKVGNGFTIVIQK